MNTCTPSNEARGKHLRVGQGELLQQRCQACDAPLGPAGKHGGVQCQQLLPRRDASGVEPNFLPCTRAVHRSVDGMCACMLFAGGPSEAPSQGAMSPLRVCDNVDRLTENKHGRHMVPTEWPGTARGLECMPQTSVMSGCAQLSKPAAALVPPKPPSHLHAVHSTVPVLPIPQVE